MRGFSLVVASGGHSSSRCAGLSLSQPLLLRSTGSRRAGSVVVAHGPSCSAACGILPDQGSNPCPLHWQADSQPLHHQGSPYHSFLKSVYISNCSKSILSLMYITYTTEEFLFALQYPARCWLLFIYCQERTVMPVILHFCSVLFIYIHSATCIFCLCVKFYHPFISVGCIIFRLLPS